MNDIELLEFLKQNHSNQAHSLNFIGKGMFSSAYTFQDNNMEKILRINTSSSDFIKDQFAERFSTKNLPIPHILDIIQINDNTWCAISNKCPGVIYNKLSLPQRNELGPKIFNTLNAICNTAIDSHSGYGNVDTNFNGKFESWEATILNQENHKIAYDWDVIFSRDFFDTIKYEAYQDQVKNLLQYLPKEKYLVHGDFGFDNLIINENNISGVIDWAEAKLGDFLFDTAWLDFWSDDITFSELFMQMFKDAGKNIRHYSERLTCYVLNIGMSSLAISGHFNHEHNYLYTIDKMNSLTDIYSNISSLQQ